MEVDREVGPVGSMQRVLLGTEEGNARAMVLARVIRVATVDDFWRGPRVIGVGFQFLFAEEQAAEPARVITKPVSESESVQQFLSAVVERDMARRGLEVRSWRGSLQTNAGVRAARISGVSARSMVIETDYAVAPGETIRVDMPGRAEESRLSIDGEVMECDPLHAGLSDLPRYRVLVRFVDQGLPEATAIAGESMHDAFDTLLQVLTSVAPRSSDPRARHLAGELSRISLFSVLTLCQIERVTGVLRLEAGTSLVRAYLSEGELVDVEIAGRDVDARAALTAALTWREGTFEVSIEPIARPRRIDQSTTALLIELVREQDEVSR